MSQEDPSVDGLDMSHLLGCLKDSSFIKDKYATFVTKQEEKLRKLQPVEMTVRNQELNQIGISLLDNYYQEVEAEFSDQDLQHDEDLTTTLGVNLAE